MSGRDKAKQILVQLHGRMKNFLFSEKSREFFIFLFFFVVAAGFWLLQTLNSDYETELSVPVRLKNVPDNVVITSEPASELQTPEEPPKKTRRPNRGSSRKGRTKKTSEENVEIST